METITSHQRILNILTKATANGFAMNTSSTIIDSLTDAESYLIDNKIGVIEEECAVASLGRGQRVDYHDGMGYHFESQGEIVDFSQHWFKPEGTKVYHSTAIDSKANVIELYYVVKQPDNINDSITGI